MQRFCLLIVFLFSLSWTFAQRYSPLIAQKVSQVAGIEETLITYEDFGPKPTGSIGIKNVNSWLVDYYTSLGYTVLLDSFLSGTASNIVIEKRGEDTTQWLIIGAHYDSVTDSYGANDNGSGVVATMQIARLIADIPTALSVRIINFDAEEIGLLGSTHYVSNTLAKSDRVSLMFNVDQLGGTKFADNSKIVCERDEGNDVSQNDLPSLLKTDTLAALIAQYTDLEPVIGPAFSTDYMPFEDSGYVITGLYQESNYSSFVHSTADRVFNMDTDATEQVIKGAVAASLYFARPLQTGVTSSELVIYPNPAQGSFRLFAEEHSTLTYRIYNNVGQVVASGTNIDGSQVVTPMVSNGLYTVSIYTAEDQYISSAKLIIAR